MIRSRTGTNQSTCKERPCVAKPFIGGAHSSVQEMAYYPVQIKQSSATDLHLRWNDGLESIISLKLLRDECPCAGCKGETVLFHESKPILPILDQAGKYEIREMHQVGNYAVQVTWGDGHSTGIYTWDYLRGLAKRPKDSQE